MQHTKHGTNSRHEPIVDTIVFTGEGLTRSVWCRSTVGNVIQLHLQLGEACEGLLAMYIGDLMKHGFVNQLAFLELLRQETEKPGPSIKDG